MRIKTEVWLACWWGLAAAGLAGCERADQLRPVTGTIVFFDGQPVGWGMVELVPESGGQPARGSIAPDGSFTVATGSRPGLRPGRHRVVISQTVPADPRLREHRHPLARADSQYAAAASSPLVVEMPPGNSTFEIRLTVERSAR
jgi:hypothetical protein